MYILQKSADFTDMYIVPVEPKKKKKKIFFSNLHLASFAAPQCDWTLMFNIFVHKLFI